MTNKIPKIESFVLLIMLVTLFITGCGGVDGYKAPPPVVAYDVSGQVINRDTHMPFPNVSIQFSGGFISVNTSAEGTWSQSGLYGRVTITPVLSGYAFNPPNRVITSAGSDLDFECFIDPYLFTATGTISKGNVGPDGSKLAGVTLSYNYPGDPVTTGADGSWTIPDIKGTVTVTPTKAGWQFTPSSFTVTKESPNVPNVVANRVEYTGLQVRTMATTYLNKSAGLAIPNTVIVDGDTIRIEEAAYLVAKYTHIADTRIRETNAITGVPTVVTIAIPATVPFLTVGKPTVAPTGNALSGGLSPNIKVMWYQNYKTLAGELAEALELSPVLPANFNVIYSLQDKDLSGNPINTETPAIMKIDWIISILGRVVHWSSANTVPGYTPSTVVPNYASVRDHVQPTDWPTNP